MTRKEVIKKLKEILHILQGATETEDVVCYITSDDKEWLESCINLLEVDEEYDEVLKILGRKEPADVAPVIHAKWIEYPHEWGRNYENSDFECSNCHKDISMFYATNYCPNCGAKMDKED